MLLWEYITNMVASFFCFTFVPVLIHFDLLYFSSIFSVGINFCTHIMLHYLKHRYAMCIYTRVVR